MSVSSARLPIFKPEASRARDGLALIFDIGGFSTFFNRPDVHSYIPKYLNHVSRCMDIALFGGECYWTTKPRTLVPLPVLPVHRKFLGDGALYIWAPEDASEFTDAFLVSLANRLWNLQNFLQNVNKACADDIPIFDLPSVIRFGLARGTVFELAIEGSEDREYIGVAVNLASRLQKYAPGLNFLASARVNLKAEVLKKSGYIKVVATGIRGFPKEIVIVDQAEYQKLSPDMRSELFQDLP
jgi:class 3 adenylate cyclase